MSNQQQETGKGQGSEVLTPQVVVETMPWKCADCGNKWQDRQDGKGVAKRGCPNCGSARIFDCNVAAVGEALKPCPFCGSQPKMHPYKAAPGWIIVECVQDKYRCGVYLYTVGETEGEAAERWNRRAIPGERAEFGQILAGLKARGMITQADVDRLERDGIKEVADA